MRLSADLHQELLSARAQTDQLFDLLDPSALYDRPIPERNRIIFYLGHLEAFDWNHLGRRCLDLPSFHPSFDTLFERGIDPDPGQLPSDQPKDWPSVAEVRMYNGQVREKLDNWWKETPLDRRQMIIEHRQMHAETFAYMLHNLPAEKKIRQPEPDLEITTSPLPEMIAIPDGCATLGQPDGGAFGWDNEFQENRIFVPAFRILRYKVTNREYLEFVRQGGTPSYFWVAGANGWLQRGMFGLIPLPLDAPVYVTRDQAVAYAAWKGMSLPSEAQYHRAAFGTPDGETNELAGGNKDFRFWDSVEVNATPEDKSAWGVEQLCGNGWEWTSTVFAPFTGFQPTSYYPGYSADFFDGKHYIVKGASARTAAQLTRRSFRNWYRSEYPYTYTGFRLVEENKAGN
jgi:formylglycine-generating enzyme required for sulfatase activity